MRVRFLGVILVGIQLCAGVVIGQAPRAAPVEVEVVKEDEIVPTTIVLGTTEPKRRSVVAASIQGYVIDYPVDEGQRVKKGVALARLRDSILQLQLKEAEAALAEMEARHQQARADLNRAKQLIEKGATTQKAFDSAVTLERTLALKIPQGQARIEILRADIRKKQVTAPFDGQVVQEHTEVGEWLDRGGKVATIVDLSSVIVRANVPEHSLAELRIDAKTPVFIDALVGKRFEGRVLSISAEGDPEARTFPVRVEVPNDGLLRASMSARVEIPIDRRRRSLVVSKDAVLLRGTQKVVFTVDKDNRAARRIVKVGASSGGRFEVLAGVVAGDRVIVRGNERVRPGSAVRIVTSTSGKVEGVKPDRKPGESR